MKTRNKAYRKQTQKRQTRLAFAPLESSSPTRDAHSSAAKGRLGPAHFAESSPIRVSRPDWKMQTEALPTPKPSSQPCPSPIAAVSPGAKDEDDEDEIVLPSGKRRKIAQDDGPAGTPTRKSARRNLENAIPHQPSPSKSPPWVSFDLGSPETSGDEEVAILSKPTSGRRGAVQKTEDDKPFVVQHEPPRRASRSKHGNEDDFVVDDDDDEALEYFSSGEEELRAARRKRKNRNRRRSKREQDELDEDLQDLQTSEVEDEQLRRTRGGIVNRQRDKNREHLELLKRRRAGEKIPRVVDSDEEEIYQFHEQDEVDINSIVHHPQRWPIMDAGDESSTDEEVVETAGDEQHPDEDDFIVDDDEGSQPSRNRHNHSGIPLEFTAFASSKPKELFVHVIEWLVKNKVAPAFSRNDELYTLSWNKVNDQIKAQAGSRLISSVWNADFKNAILARPEMYVNYIAADDDDAYLDCDACNRTNHPARYEFKFGGAAYHPDTLEPVNEDDEDGDDEDDQGDEDQDKASYDHAGHLLPSTDSTFLLGRFCAANAEMGHKLTHWKFHLNQSLLAYLEDQGVLSAEAIVAREKRSKKKREKEAEDIVDMMQETGIVDEMWRDLQNDLEDARFGMEDHVARGGGIRQELGK